jgi:hypothetical protein
MLNVANGGQALTPNCVALILDGKHGNSGAIEAWQVALTKLHEGLLGNPLQSVIKVITLSRGEPSSHSQVKGVSRDVHVDLTAWTQELTVRTITVHRSPRVAKAVQHILK